MGLLPQAMETPPVLAIFK